MKTLIAIAALLILGTQAHAANCQNLAGDFVYSNDPAHTLHIEQQGCNVTMTNKTEGGQEGAPITYVGDGKWYDDGVVEGIKISHASVVSASSFMTQTKMIQDGDEMVLSETYKLRSNGDIQKHTHMIMTDEDPMEADFLLIRK